MCENISNQGNRDVYDTGDWTSGRPSTFKVTLESVTVIPLFCATETALVSILLKHFLPSMQVSKEFRLLFRNASLLH